MKKIIAILAMIALVGGVAFAEASVSGNAIGTVNLLKSGVDGAGDDVILGSGGMDLIRLAAQGEDEDGKFGGWVRLNPHWSGATFFGHAWWKPIDQFLMRIGGNGGDGYYEKAGNTTWMFYQTATDTGVAMGGDNAWGGTYYVGDSDLGDEVGLFNFREAFYGGYGNPQGGLMFEIKPVEVFGINIVLPYFEKADSEVADIFGSLTIQFDLNLDFGNIALTYVGDSSKTDDDKAMTMGKLFLYAGIGAIENVALDIGLGFTIPGEAKGHPINVGLGAKVDVSDAFGLKARVGASLGGDKEEATGNWGATQILFDVLPFFAINDLMTVFVSIGLGMIMPDEGDNYMGFHFNPYLQVGSEWGPKFLAGVKVWQDFAYDGKDFTGADAKVKWAVPIALNVGF